MTKLIDADALKATIMSKADSMEDLWDTAGVLNAINNTPTVEPEITNDDLQSAMTESHRLGYELAETKFKRSPGEWICTSKSSFPQYEPDEYRCSICNGVGYLLDKFCKHCGAKMEVINNE